jgi:hypothetical protein
MVKPLERQSEAMDLGSGHSGRPGGDRFRGVCVRATHVRPRGELLPPFKHGHAPGHEGAGDIIQGMFAWI